MSAINIVQHDGLDFWLWEWWLEPVTASGTSHTLIMLWVLIHLSRSWLQNSASQPAKQHEHSTTLVQAQQEFNDIAPSRGLNLASPFADRSTCAKKKKKKCAHKLINLPFQMQGWKPYQAELELCIPVCAIVYSLTLRGLLFFSFPAPLL